MSRPRSIFFGTPDFAVPSLRALAEISEVALVVTQPDRRAGRGMKLSPPPVKLVAESLGVPVVQPRKVRAAAFAEQLREVGAEVGLVVAYGRILPPAVLESTRLGLLNVHGSLLPRYRGAAPIQWAIVEGERETGVCLMQMDEGMDTGPVLARRTQPIGPDDDGGMLWSRLSELGGELVREELPRYLAGELTPAPQDDALATHAPILSRADGLVDFARPARTVHDLVRGMTPWPGAFSYLEGKRVKLHRSRVLSATGSEGPPGLVLHADAQGVAVACGEGVVAFTELQFEGKRRMDAAQVYAGRMLRRGIRFGGPDA